MGWAQLGGEGGCGHGHHTHLGAWVKEAATALCIASEMHRAPAHLGWPDSLQCGAGCECHPPALPLGGYSGLPLVALGGVSALLGLVTQAHHFLNTHVGIGAGATVGGV